MKPRISLITLGVDDLERSRRFYVEGLGLPVRPESVAGEIVFLDLGRTWLALWDRGSLAEDAGLPNDRAVFPGFSMAHNVATREEVDAIASLAPEIGGRVLQAPKETSYGGYATYFADPDGFPWEVAWNPGLPQLAD